MEITPGIRDEAESEKEVNKFRVLYDLAVAMTSDHDLDKNLSMVVEQSRKLLGFDSSYIALRDERAGDVYMHTLSGITTEAFKQMRLSFGAGVGGKVATTQKGVIVGDYFQEVESPVHDIVHAEGLISGIAVPIQMGQKNLGVLYGFNRTKTTFSKSDLDTLFLLGNLAAVEIIRKRQEIDLREAHDDLEQKVQERTAELSAANEDLKQSEEKYRLLVENAQEAILVAQDGMLKFVNPKALELLAYSEDEFLSKGFTEFIHPDDQEMVLDKHMRRLRGEQFPTRYAFRLVDKDGTLKRVEIDSTLFSWEGRPAALIFMTDITERVRMEEALKQSEERYRALAENSLTGICVHQDGLHVYVNERYAKDLGYSAAELIGKPFLEVVAPQDRGMVEQRWLNRLAGKKVPTQYQLRSLNKDGSVRWREVWATVIQHNGSPAILANAIDITERKQAEESLRSLLDFRQTLIDSIPNPVFYKDVDGKYIGCNESFAALVGVPKVDVVGRSVFEVVPKDLADLWREKDQELFDGPHVQVFECALVRPDGNERSLVFHKAPLFDADGALAGLIGVVMDITDRLRAEDALRFEKQKFETLCEDAPFAMVMIAEDGTFQYANPKFQELFGYEFSEVPNGRSWFRKAFPDDAYRYEVIATWMTDLNVSKPGEKRPRVFSVTCKDGTEKIIHFRTVQLETGDHLVSFEDITHRTKAEQAIEERERFLSSVFASIQDGISVLDKELNVIRVNPTMETWYAHAKPITGKKCFEAYHAKGQPCDSCPSMRTLNTGQTAYEMVPKRGPSAEITGWLDLYSFPLIDESTGELKGVIEYVRDISERKAAEEALRDSEKKYRTILETIADGYHEVDLAGNLTLVNDSMCEIFGYPREELLGVNYRKLMDEHNAKSVFEAYNEVYRTGKPSPGTNLQNVRKDGSSRDVSVSISLIKDADGQPLGFRGIMRDVTERNKLQEQLYQAAKMEAIGTLAGGLAHDFNNLLQIVLGYADLIAIDKENKDKDFKRARLIVDAATRGRDLVNRILTFSRKVETKPRPIDLNHELKQVEHLLGRTIPKMIEIDLRLADNLRSINADPTQIEQILLNLAVNAAHAMPEGGKLVFETKNVRLDREYCRTHLETKHGEYVLLTVSDTGKGMEKEILERVFEPFFTTKGRGEGTGLGLSMVFGIVKSHGGHISCNSKPGIGTVFNIYFPATEIEIAWDPEATQIMPSFGTETILLVDDEKAIRDLGKEILTSVGYKVLTASTGLEALDMYAKAQEEISLVILDLIMPEMGGKQCLEELHKINPQLKVLIASGYCADPSTKEYLETGARGVVTKPFRMKELLQQVRKVLDSE